MALIEIDGLPINSMVIYHGELLNNQMVYYIITVFSICFLEGLFPQWVTSPATGSWIFGRLLLVVAQLCSGVAPGTPGESEGWMEHGGRHGPMDVRWFTTGSTIG